MKNKIKIIQRRILAGIIFSCTAMMILYMILYLTNAAKDRSGMNADSGIINGKSSVALNNSASGKMKGKTDVGNGSNPDTPPHSSSSPYSGLYSGSGAGDKTRSEADMGKESTVKSGDSGYNRDGESTADSSGEYIQVVIEPEKTGITISTTVSFFKNQIPALSDALKKSGFYYSERLLDQETGTKAYIIALDDNCAQNLNGYFYYLFDEKSTATVVSPFVLNISLLFEEKNRGTVTKNGTYSDPALVKALEESLKAALGKYYSSEVSRFIETEYRKNFSARMNGEVMSNPVCKLKTANLDVIFHNSFLTYVEFFINP